MMTRELLRLEATVGFQLFERRRQRLHPTARALKLCHAIEEAYSGLDTINASLPRMRAAYGEILQVSTLPTFAQSLLPEAVARLHGEAPGLTIEIDNGEALQPALLEAAVPGRAVLRHDEAPLRPRPLQILRACEDPRPDRNGRHRPEPPRGREQDHPDPQAQCSPCRIACRVRADDRGVEPGQKTGPGATRDAERPHRQQKRRAGPQNGALLRALWDGHSGSSVRRPV